MEVFGYPAFKNGQKEAIEAITHGGDCIIVIPTGGGKTIIYTLPCVIKAGISLVISPLVMLMYDQVSRLRKLGINACYFNSLLSEEERDLILHNLLQATCQYEFVFTSPEGVLSSQFMSCLQKLQHKNKVNFSIIDEAHCTQTWGKDFRPEYSQLFKLREAVKQPMIALTGTATEMTIEVIKSSLQLQNPTVVKVSCVRPNLGYSVNKRDEDGKKQIASVVKDRFSSQCGIIYCSTQANTVRVAFVLKQFNISATYYYARLDEMEKIVNAQSWLDDKVHVMCATSAFGMGIDKKNVRFVIHDHMPPTIEDLVQESGRGGRDGKPAFCLIFCKFSDRAAHLRNIASIENLAV